MPSWLKDGTNVPDAGDNEWVVLQRWAAALYAVKGNTGGVPFGEGTKPLPGDSEERLELKIASMTH